MWAPSCLHEQSFACVEITYSESLSVGRCATAGLEGGDYGDFVQSNLLTGFPRFLMATLHMDSIVSKHNPRAVRTALKDLPAGLDDTYQKVLQRIDSQNGDDREMAYTVLSWLCYAHRPLTLPELQHALAVDTDCLDFDPQSVTEQDLLISICAGLVTIDPESGIVRLVHYTAQEFFERIREERFPNAQRSIVLTCIQYLSFGALSGYYRTRDDVEQRFSQYPFLAYAASYWGYHLRGPLEKTLSDCVLIFLADTLKVSGSSQILLLLTCGWETEPSASEEEAFGMNIAAYFGLDYIIMLLLDGSTTKPDAAIETLFSDSDDHNFGTVLHWAALGNNKSSLELLLAEAGVHRIINQRNSSASTALYEAVRNSRGHAIRILMKNGADVSIRGDRNTLTPLHNAAFHGRVEDIRVLLEIDKRQEMLEQGTHEGPTALHCAASRNHFAACELLLDYGTSVYATDMYGKTPLHVAADHGAELTAGLLMNRDCSSDHLYFRARNHRTAFQSACLLGHTQIATLFLRKGVDWQLLKRIGGHDSLQSAAANGQAAMVELLLDYYPRPLPVDDSGATLCHLAARSGDGETIRLFVEKDELKILLKDRTLSGTTAVHDAARRGHVDVMKSLIDEGADLNAKDGRGRSALHYAAERDLDTMATILLCADANIEVEDEEGRTPLTIALRAQSSHVADLLLASQARRPPLADERTVDWAQQQPWWEFFDGQTKQYHIPYQTRSACDVFHAYFCLRNTPLSFLANAPSMIRKILEMAEYWIASKVVHVETLQYTMHDGDFIYLRSRPIVGRTTCPVQKIVTTTHSKDQGWSDTSGHGTYGGSFTWFDIGYQRTGAKVKPLCLVNNIHAGQSMKTHTMCWGPNGRLDMSDEFVDGNSRGRNLDIARWVRELRPGDRVVVIPKALFKGWTNIVERVELTVYTSCLLPDVQVYGGLASGSNIPTAHVAVPIGQNNVGGFESWGTSSAGFCSDIPTLWAADHDRKMRYSNHGHAT